MLLKDFIDAKDYWTARDPKTGETWLEYCLRTDMTVEAILSGRQWDERNQAKADARAVESGTPLRPWLKAPEHP